MGAFSQFEQHSIPIQCLQLLENGERELREKRYVEASDYFTKVIKYIISNNLSPDLFWSTVKKLAETYVLAKIQNRQRPICQEFIEYLESIEAKQILADFYTQILFMGDYHSEIRGMRLYESMLEPGRKAIQLWTELQQEFPLALSQAIYAMFLDASKSGEGVELMKEVGLKLDELRENGESPEIRTTAASLSIRVYGTLANMYFGWRVWDQAVKYYELILAVAEFQKDKNLLISTRISLANCYLQVGETKKAITEFIEAQKTAEAMASNESLALIHNGLHNAYTRNKEHEKAELELEQTAYVLKQLNDGAGVFSMWMDLASTYEKRQLVNKALGCYHAAGGVAKRLENPDALLTAEYKLGVLYYDQQDFDNARIHLQISQQIARKQNQTKLLNIVEKYLKAL